MAAGSATCSATCSIFMQAILCRLGADSPVRIREMRIAGDLVGFTRCGLARITAGSRDADVADHCGIHGMRMFADFSPDSRVADATPTADRRLDSRDAACRGSLRIYRIDCFVSSRLRDFVRREARSVPEGGTGQDQGLSAPPRAHGQLRTADASWTDRPRVTTPCSAARQAASMPAAVTRPTAFRCSRARCALL
jgi:hypothetical protein